jgi:hypothetical protein
MRDGRLAMNGIYPQFVRRVLTLAVASVVMAGCAGIGQQTNADAPKHCYVESGWLDSTNGCAGSGYPDCYLVCPGSRKRL